MAVLVLAVVFLLLFAFLDAWYFIRTIWLALRVLFMRRRDCTMNPLTQDEYLKETTTHCVVMPSDLDTNLHMNNSKYLRECDFARIKHWLTNFHVFNLSRSQRGRWAVSAISVRYRRELRLWQRFRILTRTVWWEEDAIYLEQRIVTDDQFVAAILLVKMAIRGTKFSELQRLMSGNPFPPPPQSPELKSWCESISHSSRQLRGQKVD